MIITRTVLTNSNNKEVVWISKKVIQKNFLWKSMKPCDNYNNFLHK